MAIMFIHIGGDTVVNSEDVVAIFDIEAKDKMSTKSFLKHENDAGRVEVVDMSDIKSFIVTNTKVYYSPISSLTLRKRAYGVEMNGHKDVE